MAKICEEAKAWVAELRAELAKENPPLEFPSDWEAYKVVVCSEGDLKRAVERVKNIIACEKEHRMDELDSLDCYRKVNGAFENGVLMETG